MGVSGSAMGSGSGSTTACLMLIPFTRDWRFSLIDLTGISSEFEVNSFSGSTECFVLCLIEAPVVVGFGADELTFVDDGVCVDDVIWLDDEACVDDDDVVWVDNGVTVDGFGYDFCFLGAGKPCAIRLFL